eukprot:3611264-Rhodomonas_salina.1
MGRYFYFNPPISEPPCIEHDNDIAVAPAIDPEQRTDEEGTDLPSPAFNIDDDDDDVAGAQAFARVARTPSPSPPLPDG